MTNPAAVAPRLVAPATLIAGLLRFFQGYEPSLQALTWSLVTGALLYLNWGERRLKRIYYIGGWLFAAVATLGKGPLGFVLPMMATFACVAAKKKWIEITRFEVVSGLLVILAVGIPWYVAMYVRHGSPFTDRLIFHDMFNRVLGHVHDTNEGDDTSFRFYIWQLGYALFPWTGLSVLGLFWWMRKPDSNTGLKEDASILLVMWFLLGFALVSFMGTKFHHYIFPSIPALAMLVGVVLDDLFGARVLLPGKAGGYVLSMGIGVALLVLGASFFWPGAVDGSRVAAGDSASPVAGVVLIAFGLGIITFGVRRFGRRPEAPSGTGASGTFSHEELMAGAAFAAAALATILIGRDLGTKPAGADQPGAIRLLHLFTYNYRRPWPDSLDFNAILSGFAVVAVVLSALLAVRSMRSHVIAAFVAFSGVWALWGLDVYMMKTSQHWGQHEIIAAYYADRASKDEPLVAYQMNWKGENFYTGNHVPAFVSSGANFTNWLRREREAGVRVMYFITESTRTGGLRNEVGARSYREVTDRNLCNKFILVRAEL